MYNISEDEDGGNPMVAGFQDELDSEDEIDAAQQGTSRPKITQDIDLSSDDEDTTHSITQTVKYDEDYVSSDENLKIENAASKNTKSKNSLSDENSAKTNSSDNLDVGKKSKSNSVSSGSEVVVKTGSHLGIDSINSTNTHSRTGSLSSNATSDTEKSTPYVISNSLHKRTNSSHSRKISSDSSRSDHMINSTNHKTEEKSSNQDSDSDSDSNQVTVLQDADINPEDFGGADVFNDWLNKQEVKILSL